MISHGLLEFPREIVLPRRASPQRRRPHSGMPEPPPLRMGARRFRRFANDNFLESPIVLCDADEDDHPFFDRASVFSFTNAPATFFEVDSEEEPSSSSDIPLCAAMERKSRPQPLRAMLQRLDAPTRALLLRHAREPVGRQIILQAEQSCRRLLRRLLDEEGWTVIPRPDEANNEAAGAMHHLEDWHLVPAVKAAAPSATAATRKKKPRKAPGLSRDCSAQGPIMEQELGRTSADQVRALLHGAAKFYRCSSYSVPKPCDSLSERAVFAHVAIPLGDDATTAKKWQRLRSTAAVSLTETLQAAS